jgi:hypothetical protein
MQVVHTEEVTGSILSIATQQTEEAYRFYLATALMKPDEKYCARRSGIVALGIGKL